MWVCDVIECTSIECFSVGGDTILKNLGTLFYINGQNFPTQCGIFFQFHINIRF